MPVEFEILFSFSFAANHRGFSSQFFCYHLGNIPLNQVRGLIAIGSFKSTIPCGNVSKMGSFLSFQKVKFRMLQKLNSR